MQCGTELKTKKLLSASPGGKLSGTVYGNATGVSLFKRKMNWWLGWSQAADSLLLLPV